MQIEEILTRPDGTRITIRVSVHINSYSNNPGANYNVWVGMAAPRKRKFINVPDTDNWEYRRLKGPERETWYMARILEVCTNEEIHAIKLKLWEQLKPR